jgi:hypothetical protein
MRGFFIHHRSSSHPSESTPLRRKLQPQLSRCHFYTAAIIHNGHGLDHPSNVFCFACLCGSCRCSFESVAYLGFGVSFADFPILPNFNCDRQGAIGGRGNMCRDPTSRLHSLPNLWRDRRISEQAKILPVPHLVFI